MKTMSLVVVCLWSLTYVIIADCQDPCSDGLHDVIDDHWRSTSFITSTTRCDENLKENWYRVQNNGTDADMPTSCHEKGCGTKFPVWMNETIPTSSVGIVNRTVCLHNSFFLGCCYHSWEIMVKNCGLFRVYHLLPTVGCNIAYCFDPSSYIDTTENTINTYQPTDATTANLPTTHDHVTEAQEMTTTSPTKTTSPSVFKSTTHELDSTAYETSTADLTTSSPLNQESTTNLNDSTVAPPYTGHGKDATTANLPTTHDHVTEAQEMTTTSPTKTTSPSVFKSTTRELDSTAYETSTADLTTSSPLNQESTTNLNDSTVAPPYTGHGKDGAKNMVDMVVVGSLVGAFLVICSIGVFICMKKYRRGLSKENIYDKIQDDNIPGSHIPNVLTTQNPEPGQHVNFTDRTSSDPGVTVSDYIEIIVTPSLPTSRKKTGETAYENPEITPSLSPSKNDSSIQPIKQTFDSSDTNRHEVKVTVDGATNHYEIEALSENDQNVDKTDDIINHQGQLTTQNGEVKKAAGTSTENINQQSEASDESCGDRIVIKYNDYYSVNRSVIFIKQAD